MSTSVKEPPSCSADTSLAGKYLTFILGSEEFGLEILKVREIIGYMQITAIPRTPAYIKGVINLRGQVIPVIDMRAKFEMMAADITDQTCIVVVDVSSRNGSFFTGVIVDRVREVLDIDAADIEPSPEFDSHVSTSFILGMGKIGGTVKILLDIDEVLRGEGLESLAGTQ